MGLWNQLAVIQGRVGKINELREFGDNCVINFSIAETQRKKEGDKWVDGDTLWTNVDLWNDEARMFVKSDIVPGTVVTVIGQRKARSYETDNGPRTTESVTASIVAVSITPWTYIEKVGHSDSKGQSKPAAKTASAAKPVTKPAAKPAAKPAQDEDLFADTDDGADDFFFDGEFESDDDDFLDLTD